MLLRIINYFVVNDTVDDDDDDDDDGIDVDDDDDVNRYYKNIKIQ